MEVREGKKESNTNREEGQSKADTGKDEEILK